MDTKLETDKAEMVWMSTETGGKEEFQRRFVDVVNKDMLRVGVTQEDTRNRMRWTTAHFDCLVVCCLLV